MDAKTRDARAATRLRVKRAKLIAMIKLWAKDHGGSPPRASDWMNVKGTRWPSYLTVVRAFGTWDEGIAAAGFEPRGRGRPLK